MDSDDPIAPTGYMKLKKIKLELKLPQLDLNARFANLPLKIPNEHVQILDQPDDSQVTNGNSKFNCYFFLFELICLLWSRFGRKRRL